MRPTRSDWPMTAREVMPGGVTPEERFEHLLKTPLTSIRSAGEIIRDHPDLTALERSCFIDMLVAESERLCSVVEAVLAELRSRPPANRSVK